MDVYITILQTCAGSKNGGDSYESCQSASCLCTGATVAIACIMTSIVSITAATIITAIVTRHVVKRKLDSNHQLPDSPQEEKVLYEQVSSPSHSKNDLELQRNPIHHASDKMIMETNPAYESCN